VGKGRPAGAAPPWLLSSAARPHLIPEFTKVVT
jgi:hypothetical protein